MLIMMLQIDGLDKLKPNDLLGQVLTYDKYENQVDERDMKVEEKKKQTMAFKATSSSSKAPRGRLQ